MENASKALLIAASILIAVLLISMGMNMFKSTSGTTDNVEETMQTTEMATFNNKFTAYVGSNKPAASVKTLANLIIANNAKNPNHIVKLNILSTGETSDAATITSKIADLTGSYKISIPATGGYSNGYVILIEISNS